MARKHSSEAFYALDDQLEAAVFSALVELMSDLDETPGDQDEPGHQSFSSIARNVDQTRFCSYSV